MRKIKDNCSSVGIIHQASDPANVFIEMKTPGYPTLAYVGKGNLIGGCWEKQDRTTLETWQRETLEELTLGNPAIKSEEMDELFEKGHLRRHSALFNITPTAGDKERLVEIVTAICSHAKPYAAFVQTVARSVFDSANPKNTRGNYEGLCHVFSVPLPDDQWQPLVELQQRYGNLSSEAQGFITSLEDIVAKNIRIGWAQDRILQRFFLDHDLGQANQMPLMPDTNAEEVPFEESYDGVLKKYDVEKIPKGFVRPNA